MNSSLYEFNEAVNGYYRHWERTIGWLTREIKMELIMGNPNYEKSSKPKSKDELYKFSIDKEPEKEPKVMTAKKIQQDIRVMEQMFK